MFLNDGILPRHLIHSQIQNEGEQQPDKCGSIRCEAYRHADILLPLTSVSLRAFVYVCVHASINRMESAVTAIANGDGMENALCIQNFIETESTPPYIENRSPSTNVYCVEGCSFYSVVVVV